MLSENGGNYEGYSVTQYVSNLRSLLDPNERIEVTETGLKEQPYCLLVRRDNKVVMNHTLDNEEYKELVKSGLDIDIVSLSCAA